MKALQRAKHIFTSLFCALLLSLCPALPAIAQDGNETLIVAVPSDRCPMFYLDPDTKEIAGIGVDLMQVAAEEAGYSAQFMVIQEPTLKEALDNSDYDVVMPFGSAVPSASGAASIVSDNLLQTPFTFVTKGNARLPPINEMKVGMLSSLGAGAETVSQLYPGIQINLYDTMPDCVAALRSGEVDALLHNSYVWSYVLQKPSYSDLKVQPSAMFSMDFRAGTLDTPEGQAIIERLNQGIAALPDTRRQAVILDHTSRHLYQYDFSDYLYQYGLFFLFGGLLFISLIVIVLLRQRALTLENEERLRRLIDHDSLTGVLSLNGFRKRVEELLRNYPDAPYLLSYNNIKNFKYVNDSLGMDAGDDLLRFWADMSMEVLSDKEAICRISGDHFGVLRLMGGEEQMRHDDENVFEPIRNYFIDRGGEKRLQTCTGVYALTPDDYQHPDVDHMLDLARVAERRLRDTNREGFEFYNPREWERGKRMADVVGHLPLALHSGEFQVWYQPQSNYTTGDIIGMEALCRWNHAKLGLISPSEFIPVLEGAGLIFDMDSFVWDKVCQDLHRWNERGERRSVSVNLSRQDITDEHDIPEHFARLVKQYDLTPDQLRVEITETAFVEDPELLIRTTNSLRDQGFQVEMDDFGSGYSSLHMLKEVSVDRIKLDLHFLTEAGDAEKSRTIVSYMIQMVHALGMGLIAEGVENVSQANFLQSQGCSEMQGFHFYKPMPVDELEAIL